jgi:hypothetical protein
MRGRRRTKTVVVVTQQQQLSNAGGIRLLGTLGPEPTKYLQSTPIQRHCFFLPQFVAVNRNTA